MPETALERQIRSQPQELDRLATHHLGHDVVERLAQCRRIWLVGTGTSFHAAELGAAMFYEAGRGARPSRRCSSSTGRRRSTVATGWC
jgi:glucosamine--fructose-6-phosphate aminotransferase (isomerizing)